MKRIVLFFVLATFCGFSLATPAKAMDSYKLLERLELYENDPKSIPGSIAVIYVRGAIEAHLITCGKDPAQIRHITFGEHLKELTEFLRGMRAQKGEVFWKEAAVKVEGAVMVLIYLTDGELIKGEPYCETAAKD